MSSLYFIDNLRVYKEYDNKNIFKFELSDDKKSTPLVDAMLKLEVGNYIQYRDWGDKYIKIPDRITYVIRNYQILSDCGFFVDGYDDQVDDFLHQNYAVQYY